jgi:hypothetical protein
LGGAFVCGGSSGFVPGNKFPRKLTPGRALKQRKVSQNQGAHGFYHRNGAGNHADVVAAIDYDFPSFAPAINGLLRFCD